MGDYWLDDWRNLMAAIRHWHGGANPYAPFQGFDGAMNHAGYFAYPPPVLLLASPLALLPWQLSGLLLVLASAAAFEAWARLSSGRSALAWLVLWVPLAQGLVIGQTTLLALAGLLFAERMYGQRRDWPAALLLSLALLKPQITILAGAWLVFIALRERRWRFLLAGATITAALWAASVAIAGPQIVPQWLGGLAAYDDVLPNRPLLFPPLGALVGLLAVVLWRRHGRGDIFGLLLLLNTLIYPLSVIYSAAAIAFVVIRWRRDWTWHPLVLSWALAFFFPLDVRTPDSIAAFTQATVMTGLFPFTLYDLRLTLLGLAQNRKP